MGEMKDFLMMFILDRLSFMDRKKGELGMLYDEGHTLYDVMTNNKYIDWTNVKTVQCHPDFARYTIEDISKYWDAACKIAKKYRVTLIYQIGCTVFVVSPISYIDEMNNIISKPKFFDTYYYNDYLSHSNFDDFSCNADIVIKMRLKTVGPDMPRLTQQYFEYMDYHNKAKMRIRNYKREIENEFASLAEYKLKTYDKLNHNDNILDRKELEPLSPRLKDWANKLWHLIMGVFDHYEYFDNVHSDTMMGSNCFELITDEIGFVLRYLVTKYIGTKEIRCILSILNDIASSKGVCTDPIKEIQNLKWDYSFGNKEYMEKVCKEIVKS